MDSGTMVRAAGDEMGTVRVASTMSDGANTMIEHDDTLPSQLGTMVINSEEEEEEGTMKSKALIKQTNFAGRRRTFQREQILMVHMDSVLKLLSVVTVKGVRVLESWGSSGGFGEGGSRHVESEAGKHQQQEGIDFQT